MPDICTDDSFGVKRLTKEGNRRRQPALRVGLFASIAAAVAQRLQRHDWLRCPSDNDAMRAGLTVTVAHQHGVSNLPLSAGPQSFGAPHTGHCKLGFGNIS
jgi:hypothetical protein